MPRYEITVTRTKVFSVRAASKRAAEDAVLLGEVEEKESKEEVQLAEATGCVCAPWSDAPYTICEERSPSGEWRCSREYQHADREHVACSGEGPDDEDDEHNLVTWVGEEIISGSQAESERQWLAEREDEWEDEEEEEEE